MHLFPKAQEIFSKMEHSYISLLFSLVVKTFYHFIWGYRCLWKYVIQFLPTISLLLFLLVPFCDSESTWFRDQDICWTGEEWLPVNNRCSLAKEKFTCALRFLVTYLTTWDSKLAINPAHCPSEVISSNLEAIVQVCFCFYFWNGHLNIDFSTMESYTLYTLSFCK